MSMTREKGFLTFAPALQNFYGSLKKNSSSRFSLSGRTTLSVIM